MFYLTLNVNHQTPKLIEFLTTNIKINNFEVVIDLSASSYLNA